MSEIARQFRNVSFSPNIFTPYPGIPIWPQLRELGVPEPKSLREWMNMPLGANMLPWLQGRELERLQRMLDVLPAQQPDSSPRPKSFPLLRRSVRRACAGAGSLAIASSRYSFPWELWLTRSTERLVQRRSLVTGQELPKEPASAC